MHQVLQNRPGSDFTSFTNFGRGGNLFYFLFQSLFSTFTPTERAQLGAHPCLQPRALSKLLFRGSCPFARWGVGGDELLAGFTVLNKASSHPHPPPPPPPPPHLRPPNTPHLPAMLKRTNFLPNCIVKFKQSLGQKYFLHVSPFPY